jgi:hypothetical protein
VEQLISAPKDKCFMKFYRHNRLVVLDSKDNDNLYLVRSGKCRVLMAVERIPTRAGIITPRLTLARKELRPSGMGANDLELLCAFFSMYFFHFRAYTGLLPRSRP